MFEAFAAALIATAAAQIVPGPNFVAVVAAALGQGRRAAIFVTLGVSSGVMVWVTAVAFGLAVVLAAFPVLLTFMKIIGGCYLLYVAAKALRTAFRSKSQPVSPQGLQRSGFSNWCTGLLVVLSNPKAGLMWIAIVSFLFSQGLGGAQVLSFAPVGALSAFVIYGVYALFFSSRQIMNAYLKFQHWFEFGISAAFGAMGAALLMSGVREVHR